MKEAAISIILFDQNVLLVKRRDVPVWVLPGGGIDDNETPEISCIREAEEETGITPILVRKVGTWLPINRLGSATHVFECKADALNSDLKPQEESEEVRFFPLNHLPPAFFFLHRTFLHVALQNTPDRIYFLTELTYWQAIKTFIAHPFISVRYLITRLRA